MGGGHSGLSSNSSGPGFLGFAETNMSSGMVNKGARTTLVLAVTFSVLAAGMMFYYWKYGKNSTTLSFANIYLILALFLWASYYNLKY